MLDQKADLHAAKQSARRVYSKGERLRILELYSLGNLALEIQALLPEDPPRPPLDYIQTTIDNERRRTRAGLPAYEALHLMCRDILAEAEEKIVMLYLVDDPAVNPDDYPKGLGLPVTALQIVVCATVDMVDSMLSAEGIGIDTKWRTREDKGCIQAVMAFAQRTQPNLPAEHRPEFRAGYRHQKARCVTIALANLDNYWTVKCPPP